MDRNDARRVGRERLLGDRIEAALNRWDARRR